MRPLAQPHQRAATSISAISIITILSSAMLLPIYFKLFDIPDGTAAEPITLMLR